MKNNRNRVGQACSHLIGGTGLKLGRENKGICSWRGGKRRHGIVGTQLIYGAGRPIQRGMLEVNDGAGR